VRGGEKKSVIRHLSGAESAVVGKLIRQKWCFKSDAAASLVFLSLSLSLVLNKQEEFALKALSCYNGEKLTRK